MGSEEGHGHHEAPRSDGDVRASKEDILPSNPSGRRQDNTLLPVVVASAGVVPLFAETLPVLATECIKEHVPPDALLMHELGRAFHALAGLVVHPIWHVVAIEKVVALDVGGTTRLPTQARQARRGPRGARTATPRDQKRPGEPRRAAADHQVRAALAQPSIECLITH